MEKSDDLILLEDGKNFANKGKKEELI